MRVVTAAWGGPRPHVGRLDYRELPGLHPGRPATDARTVETVTRPGSGSAGAG